MCDIDYLLLSNAINWRDFLMTINDARLTQKYRNQFL